MVHKVWPHWNHCNLHPTEVASPTLCIQPFSDVLQCVVHVTGSTDWALFSEIWRQKHPICHISYHTPASYCSNSIIHFSKQRQEPVGFEVLTAMFMKSCIFWDITQFSTLKVIGRFGGTCRYHPHGRRISQARALFATFFTLVSFVAYSSTSQMEATCCSETSVDFKRAARRYIPEDRTCVTQEQTVQRNYTRVERSIEMRQFHQLFNIVTCISD
jgi:hypothetical protein